MTVASGPKRRAVPLKIQLRVALRQLGLDPDRVIVDHSPPLALRAINDDGTDYDPPQHSEMHLQFLSVEDNQIKTYGRLGESKLSVTGNGDISRIAKTKRLREAQEFHRQLLAIDEKPKINWPRKKHKWPKRPFPKKWKTNDS